MCRKRQQRLDACRCVRGSNGSCLWKKDSSTVSLHIVENREVNEQIHTQNTQYKKWRLSSFFFHSSTSIGSAISPLKNWLKCRLMQS